MTITALVPLVQRRIVDNVIVAHNESLLPLAAILVVAALVTYGTTFVRRYFGGRLALDVQHDLRNEIFGSLSRLDGARQDELQTGQIIGRATSDITMVQGLLSMMPIMIGNMLLFVVSLVVMVTLSPLLTLVALAVGPGLLWVATLARKRLFPATWDAQQQNAAVAGVVDDAVTGVRVVKGFGQEEQELDEAGAGREAAVRLAGARRPADRPVQPVAAGHPGARPGRRAGARRLPRREGHDLPRHVPRVLHLPRPARRPGPDAVQPAHDRPAGPGERDPGVRGDRLAADRDREAGRDRAARRRHARRRSSTTSRSATSRRSRCCGACRCTSQPGETVALVGTSGSGKSTISMLLPRFYDVQSGAVRIGGHDVRDLTIDSIRASIGFVMEDSFLFSESVRANIAYGRPDATDEQIVAAARGGRGARVHRGAAERATTPSSASRA